MDMEALERNAKAAAVKKVVNIFQESGDLDEKIEQYKKGINQKYVTTETRLKRARMPSQIDGIIIGLKYLNRARINIMSIQSNYKNTVDAFAELLPLGDRLKEIQIESMRYSQYATAIEILKHLFTMPESVEKTKQWISEGELLHAHLYLIDLENSRDNLLYELHKLLPKLSPADKLQVTVHYEVVESLSQLLQKQLKLVLGRTLNTVRREPTVLVTVLRIIEREEKRDAVALRHKEKSGFLPPGRPKKWRDMAFKELEKAVQQRIEGAQVQDRSDSKMWLVRYLELCRQFILEDLRVVKTLCSPCFPSSYDIVNKFVRMYHQSLSSHLEKIVSNDGLEGNEYVTLLSWARKTYFSEELMGHPDLNIDISSVGPLLKPWIANKLRQNYLNDMENNYKEWMQKTLETEKKDWNSESSPAEIVNNYYSTSTPIIIFQMVHDNLDVANTVGPDLTQRALVLGLDQVKNFGKMYREAIIELKKKHFKNRNLIPYFTHHMITILNDCLQFQELTEKMRSKTCETVDGHFLAIPNYDSLMQAFRNLRDEAALYLLEGAFIDLKSHFQDLITSKWMTTSIPIDTICLTLEDYFQDYVHLKRPNLEYVVFTAQDLVAKRYITAMFQKKIIFKTSEERRQAAAKIAREVEQLRAFFVRIAPDITERTNSPLRAIADLAEILKSDTEVLSFDLHTLVERFPDITDNHLNRLLKLRSDMKKSHRRRKVAYVRQSTTQSEVPKHRSIFHQIPRIKTKRNSLNHFFPTRSTKHNVD